MNFLTRLGILYSCGITLLFNAIFVIAYLQPSKTVVFAINEFGEADLEMALVILTMTPIVLYSTMRIMQMARNNVVGVKTDLHSEAQSDF